EPRTKSAPPTVVRDEESGPKFNPFEVGAKRKSRTPFAASAEDEGPQYGLVATGPAVPSHEIETDERAIEVSVLWGDRNVLNVDYLNPPRDYYVGEPNGEDVDFILGHDAIGVDRMPLCVAEGAGVTAIVPEGAKGEAMIGHQTRSFDLMRGQGDFRPSSRVAGALEFPVPEGGSVRIKHRNFTFIVKDVKAGKKVAGHAKLDVRPMIYVAGAALFASLVLTMFYFQPPRPRGLSSDLLATQFLMEPEELEEPEPEWLNGSDSSGGGTGKAHEGEQGQMGDETAEKTKNKYGIQGPEDNPDPVMAREQAKEEARTAGIIGTLASMQGSFNAPTSPYGADFALGNDPTSALGAMTGNDIGQNFGFGGLGLRGTGRGGGGLGQGTIGMGNFGTIRHDRPRRRPRRRRGWLRSRCRRLPRTLGGRAAGSERRSRGSRLALEGSHPSCGTTPHQRGEVLLRATAQRAARPPGTGDHALRHLADRLGPVGDGGRLEPAQCGGRGLHRAGRSPLDLPSARWRRCGGRKLSVPARRRRPVTFRPRRERVFLRISLLSSSWPAVQEAWAGLKLAKKAKTAEKELDLELLAMRQML
ncbi:MAG: hypothetical protein AMJ62_03260, partial [Myxococcales bacterium SG8_38]